MADNFNIDVEDYPSLDAAARKRVQDALHKALEHELKAAGHHSPTGVFGDGSVKGAPRLARR
jgi:hypothetical protein